MEWIDSNSNWPENENSYYWVKINDKPVRLYHLNRYPNCDCWQDLTGNDYDVDGTAYIEIIKPETPTK